MPHSIVLNIVPKSPIYPNFLSGKHLHALFLTLISSVDLELGNQLHESNIDKAFTISNLQIYQQSSSQKLIYSHIKNIPANTSCWWRITFLDDRLFGHLTKLWLNINPTKPWHLGSADLYITNILGTPQKQQPWSNFQTYPELYDHASDEQRKITCQFATPTTFRQTKFDSSLPTPEAVFKSLLRRWNKYSNNVFSEDIIDYIFPSKFDIFTDIVEDSRSKFIGCLGHITYQIKGDLEPEIIKQINTLADFAIYSGVGRKTTMGMGMVRRV